MNTHGVGATVGGRWTLQHLPAREMRPLAVVLGPRRGDARVREPAHGVGPVTGKRTYPERPNMLDCMVSMGAVAAVTSRVKVAPSVLVSPYRHPLSDARCIASIDAYAPGRVVLGVGTGWMAEEFDVLGVDYETQAARTEECIEVYRRCFRDEVVAYAGEHFDFANVSVDPKPTTVPPIVFGGVTKKAARIAARSCDGFYPTFVDPLATPNRYDDVLDLLGRELDSLGRSPSSMHLLAVLRVRLLDVPDDSMRMLGTGTADQIVEDVAALGARGFSHLVVHLDCPTGSMEEYRARLDRFGESVVPAVGAIAATGPWASDPI